MRRIAIALFCVLCWFCMALLYTPFVYADGDASGESLSEEAGELAVIPCETEPESPAVTIENSTGEAVSLEQSEDVGQYDCELDAGPSNEEARNETEPLIETVGDFGRDDSNTSTAITGETVQDSVETSNEANLEDPFVNAETATATIGEAVQNGVGTSNEANLIAPLVNVETESATTGEAIEDTVETSNEVSLESAQANVESETAPFGDVVPDNAEYIAAPAPFPMSALSWRVSQPVPKMEYTAYGDGTFGAEPMTPYVVEISLLNTASIPTCTLRLEFVECDETDAGGLYRASCFLFEGSDAFVLAPGETRKVARVVYYCDGGVCATAQESDISIQLIALREAH